MPSEWTQLMDLAQQLVEQRAKLAEAGASVRAQAVCLDEAGRLLREAAKALRRSK